MYMYMYVCFACTAEELVPASTAASACCSPTMAPCRSRAVKHFLTCLLLLAVHVESVMRTVSMLPLRLQLRCHRIIASAHTSHTPRIIRASVSFTTDVLPWCIQHP